MASVFHVYAPSPGFRLSDAPEGPSVGIRLGQHGYAIDGSILVGPMMASDRDIDKTIDALIDELEKVRKQAKKELQRR